MTPRQFFHRCLSDERIALPTRIGLAFIAGTAFALASWEPPVSPDDRADAARAVESVLTMPANIHPSRLIYSDATATRRKAYADDAASIASYGEVPRADSCTAEQTAAMEGDRTTIDHPHSRGPP